jgi:hypothetical protein
MDTAWVIHDESGKKNVLIYQLFTSFGQEHEQPQQQQKRKK